MSVVLFVIGSLYWESVSLSVLCVVSARVHKNVRIAENR